MNNPVITALNPQAASTTSLDLPPALASILAMPSAAATTPMSAAAPMTPATPPAATLGGALGGAPSMQAQPLPSFQEGGMIGPGGMPMPGPQGQPVPPMDPAQRDQLLNQSLSQNPQVVQEIQAALAEGLQTGEITAQELNMIIQLTQVAAQNPDMYQYVRQFAIQQGIATEQDLPQQYDEGLVIALLTVAKAAQQMMQGGQNMMPPANAPMQSLKAGGTVKGKTDGPVPIMAHEGEYVIPKNVVQMKGKEFFDRLVEQYKDKA